MNKKICETEINKIANKLNTTFLIIANTIIKQGTSKENEKHIKELILELKK